MYKTKKTFYSKKGYTSKELINISHALPNNIQVDSTLYTAKEACVLKGMRLQYNCETSTISNIRWCLLVVKEGRSPNAISTTPLAKMYVPEQEVWAAGAVKTTDLTNNANLYGAPVDIHVKTSRKLEQGDKLYFVVISGSSSGSGVGLAQFLVSS